MLKRRKNKIPVNPELRLAEIELQLEVVRKEIDEKEQNEPPYDMDDPAGSLDRFQEYMKPEWELEAKLGREKRILMTPEFSDLSDYGDVMSLKNWLECVKGGGFIDYDGYGNYVKDGKESDIMIYPSDVKHNSVRKDFDTIIWFNR